jgi:MFS family permease
MLIGGIILWAFFRRQKHLDATGREPLVHVSMFSIKQLRSGLTVLGSQYAITAGLFFMVPVYLQMTLGLDALQTGIKIFPLSVSIIIFSIIGTRLSNRISPRRIVRIGQVILVVASIVLLGSVDVELRNGIFALGMFSAGAALGLLASQIGNVNMSAVSEKETSEVGGLQGVFQNLGSSLGTALIGSVLIAALGTSFASGVATSDLSDPVKATIAEQTVDGVEIIPTATVEQIATDNGLSTADAQELTDIYTESQVSSLQTAFFALVVISLISLLFSRFIPNQLPEPRPAGKAKRGKRP